MCRAEAGFHLIFIPASEATAISCFRARHFPSVYFPSN